MIRIVKMTFQAKQVNAFLENFERNKEKIRAFEGCQHLELWQDKADGQTFFTYSWWEDEAALEAYRSSELFRGIWRYTKSLFSERAQAWSVESIQEV